MKYFVVILMGMWMFICSIQDIKRKEIHVALLLIGIVGSLLGSVFLIDISIQDRILGVALGGVLLLLNLITKGQIGIADGIIVSIIGALLGFYISSGILLLALLLSAIVSLVLIVLKKVKRKTTIPFIPFLLAAYMGVLAFI